LTKSWDVLRPDLRGHGKSFSRGTLNLEIWCKDLRDILDAEGYDQALLIGHSLGAQVAIQFAARYPARVTALAIIDPVFHVAMRGGLRVMARLRFIFRILTECIRLLNKIGLRRRTIAARDLQQLDRETRKNLLDTGKKREMIELYSSPWQDFRFFPIASYLKELLEITRPLPALEKINAPILALLSSGITYTDPGITRRILDGHPRSETVTVAAHHWPLTENPEQVRSTIEQWCARLPI
jgi:pimeloyl-ACP methyl ester carboxylesterase